MIPADEGKIHVLQWSVTGLINHTPKQAPCPEAVGQHKTNSMLFSCSFVCVYGGDGFLFVFVLLGFFFLHVLISVFMFCGIFFLMREEEHEVG